MEYKLDLAVSSFAGWPGKLGLLVMLFLILPLNAESAAQHHTKIFMSPPVHEVVKFVNETYIVTCSTTNDMQLRWLNPKGQDVPAKRGRVHSETIDGSFALVFERITIADRGVWSCVWVEGKDVRNTFTMIINEEIFFVDTPTLQEAQEYQDAVIRCEVKGDPEPDVSWSYNGILLIMPSNKYRKLADGLFIKNVTRDDVGEYTCKGYQVSPNIVNSKERIIRLNIRHMPVLRARAQIMYGYINGTVNLTCEAEAEPEANFTWFRLGKKVFQTEYLIHSEPHVSILEVSITNDSVLGDYKCKASNELGSLDSIITLKMGEKPEPPSKFVLRGVNYDTLDVDVGAIRPKNQSEMDIIGYRFEIVSFEDYRRNKKSNKWLNARQIDFPFEDEITYLLTNLSPGTRYLVRAATRNPAGYSDFTQPKEFRTLTQGISSSLASISFRKELKWFLYYFVFTVLLSF